MISFKAYKQMNIREKLENDKNGTKYLEQKALKWLNGKYGDIYDFKYIRGMEMDGNDCKSYSVSVDDEHFKLNLRKFKSDLSSKKKDVVGFDIIPSVLPAEVEKDEEL